MQKLITPDEIQAAARQLSRSHQGRVAMQWLIDILAEDGLDLDLLDQRAFLALLGGGWKGQRDVVCDTIRETLATASVSGSAKRPPGKGPCAGRS